MVVPHGHRAPRQAVRIDESAVLRSTPIATKLKHTFVWATAASFLVIVAMAAFMAQYLASSAISKSEDALKGQVSDIAGAAIADVGDAVEAILTKGVSGMLLPPAVAMQDARGNLSLLAPPPSYADTSYATGSDKLKVIRGTTRDDRFRLCPPGVPGCTPPHTVNPAASAVFFHGRTAGLHAHFDFSPPGF